MDSYVIAERRGIRAGIAKISVRPNEDQIVVSPCLSNSGSIGYHTTRHWDMLHFRKYSMGAPSLEYPPRTLQRHPLHQLATYEVISLKQVSRHIFFSDFFKRYPSKRKHEILLRHPGNDVLYYTVLGPKNRTKQLTESLHTDSIQSEVAEYTHFDLVMIFEEICGVSSVAVCDVTHMYFKLHPSKGIGDFLRFEQLH